MNSIDSKIPRRTPCGDHVHDCPQLAETLDALREENARLREAVGLATTCAPQMEMDSTHPVKMMQEVCRVFAILTRERDEARAEVKP